MCSVLPPGPGGGETAWSIGSSIQHSKHIIDEIDAELAEHYDLSGEELDYIINYDIKYRMGVGEAGGEP